MGKHTAMSFLIVNKLSGMQGSGGVKGGFGGGGGRPSTSFDQLLAVEHDFPVPRVMVADWHTMRENGERHWHRMTSGP